MECERFKKLLKSWYIQVQNELLAPARMVDFMESHVAECPVCMMDPEARKDITKIITLVLPQDKLKQTIRNAPSEDHDDLAEETEDTGTSDEEVTEEDEEAEGEDLSADEEDEESENDEDLDEEAEDDEEV